MPLIRRYGATQRCRHPSHHTLMMKTVWNVRTLFLIDATDSRRIFYRVHWSVISFPRYFSAKPCYRFNLYYFRVDATNIYAQIKGTNQYAFRCKFFFIPQQETYPSCGHASQLNVNTLVHALEIRLQTNFGTCSVVPMYNHVSVCHSTILIACDCFLRDCHFCNSKSYTAAAFLF